jgi:hypothetical protein
MSSTTRVGFVIPGINDFADEGVYYDNNVTTYEAELPSTLSVSLPGTGSYTGQIRTVALASPNSYEPARPYQTYVWNGTAWIPVGAFGFKKDLNAYFDLGDGNPVASSGVETFQSAATPGFSAIQVGPNQTVRFNCNVSTRSAEVSGTGNNSAIFNGKFNIFVNPTSGAQPTPTTPGAIRLSFPLVCSDDNDATQSSLGAQSTHYHYGELLYLPSVAGLTTMGVAAYLSSTLTKDDVGTHIYGEVFTAANVYNSTIVTETLGEM